MYLKTAFGLSETYYSGEDGRPFQGVVQGNGVAPPLWLIITIFLARYLCQKKVVTQLVTSLSGLVVPLVALLHIDGTGLCVFNSGCDSTKEVVQKAQNLLTTWYKVLKVIGGSLKISKFYWILYNYQ